MHYILNIISETVTENLTSDRHVHESLLGTQRRPICEQIFGVKPFQLISSWMIHSQIRLSSIQLLSSTHWLNDSVTALNSSPDNYQGIAISILVCSSHVMTLMLCKTHMNYFLFIYLLKLETSAPVLVL